jgi:hypothetical protein
MGRKDTERREEGGSMRLGRVPALHKGGRREVAMAIPIMAAIPPMDNEKPTANPDVDARTAPKNRVSNGVEGRGYWVEGRGYWVEGRGGRG